jgi:hypothetical protein
MNVRSSANKTFGLTLTGRAIRPDSAWCAVTEIASTPLLPSPQVHRRPESLSEHFLHSRSGASARPDCPVPNDRPFPSIIMVCWLIIGGECVKMI